jgi:hypothetical protein
MEMNGTDFVMKFADGIGSRECQFLEVLLHGIDHRRRTAKEKLAVGSVWVWKMFLDMLFGDEANAAFPGRRGVIEDKEDLELAWVEPQELMQVVLEKDIFLVDVGVDESNSGFVLGIAKNGTDDLDHGGKTSTTGNHTEVVDHARGVDKVTLGALDANFVSNLEASKNTRNVALLVSLKLNKHQALGKKYGFGR